MTIEDRSDSDREERKKNMLYRRNEDGNDTEERNSSSIARARAHGALITFTFSEAAMTLLVALSFTLRIHNMYTRNIILLLRYIRTIFTTTMSLYPCTHTLPCLPMHNIIFYYYNV